MVYCHPWNHSEKRMDQLPEMGILRPLYRNGLGMRPRICPYFPLTPESRFRMAAPRRYHLYYRRCHLRLKASYFQRQTQKLRFARNFPRFCHAWKRMPLHRYVLLRNTNRSIKLPNLNV